MAIIKCKMCGGDMELDPDKTYGTCEYCGSTMTLPKVEDDQRAAAFNRGNHFRRIGEFDKALIIYERIVRENDADAEAHWCCALCRFGIEYVEDPDTFEWLPTCHRASFDSFLEDVDYLAALEYSDGVTRRHYQRDAAKIAQVQRGILATSQNTEPYDVFICYKESDEQGERTRDSLLAQDIYYQLTEQGRRVFFARISLEDVMGAQYEPYIFAALNSARVMIVVGTKPEHLNAVWVKNEWSRFLTMMKKDHSKLLLPCYRDMDPYDLPDQLSVLQSYDMSKIGFIQDLIRGVAKVLDAQKKPEVVSQTVVVQPAAPVNAVNPMLRRGTIALEDREWDKADEFFEEVLNQDPECAQAYIGKALAELRCVTLEELSEKRILRSNAAEAETLELETQAEWVEEIQPHVEEMVSRYVIYGYLSEEWIRKAYRINKVYYQSCVQARKEQLEQERLFWEQNKNLSRAVKFGRPEDVQVVTKVRDEVISVLTERLREAEEADAQVAADSYAAFPAYVEQVDADLREHYQKMLAKQAVESEERYAKAKTLMRDGKRAEDFREAKQLFVEIADYKDSMELAKICREQEVRAMRIQGSRTSLENERDLLKMEYDGLNRFFGARRREEIEIRLAQIYEELKGLE